MVDRVIRVIIDPTGAKSGGAQVEKAVGGIDKKNKQATKSSKALSNAIKGLVAGLTIREIVRYADAWTTTSNRLRLVTAGTVELAQIQDELLDLSNRTRSSFESTVDLYSRVARSSEELGLSHRDLLAFTESVSQAIQVSGATAAEASAGVIQFSQGLAAGALRGDELRSVLEQLPRLARALSDGLGISIGELRKLGEAGLLTTEQVIGAIQDQASTLETEFALIEITTAQSLTILKNNVLELVGEFNNATDSTTSLNTIIVGLADGVEFLASGMGELQAQTLESRANFVFLLSTIEKIPPAILRIALTQIPFHRFIGFVRDDIAELDAEIAAIGNRAFILEEELRRAARLARSPLEEIVILQKRISEEDLSAGATAASQKDIAKLILGLEETELQLAFTKDKLVIYRLELAGASVDELTYARALIESNNQLATSAELREKEEKALAKRRLEAEKNRQSDLDMIMSFKELIEAFKLSREEQVALIAVQRLSSEASEEQKLAVRELALELAALEQAEQEVADRAQQLQQLATTAVGSLGSAFEDAVLGGGKLSDIFKGLEEDVIRLIFRFAILEPLARSLAGFFTPSGSTGSGKGSGGGSGGGGGGVAAFIGGLFGLNHGGEFEVGGKPGIDKNLVAFFGTKGETVKVTPAGEKSSGGSLSIFNTFVLPADIAVNPTTQQQIAARIGVQVASASNRNN